MTGLNIKKRYSFLSKKILSRQLYFYLIGTSCCSSFLRESKDHLHKFFSETIDPEQADLIVVFGSINAKMKMHLDDVIEQTTEHTVVLAVGDCVQGKGPFSSNHTSLVEAHFSIKGCPPEFGQFDLTLKNLRDEIHKNIVGLHEN